MKDRQDEIHSHEGQEATPSSSQANSDPTEASTRRELIERYGKYALVGAPLLLFASKAHAIHSRP
jgi:hypothetical protein